ncbi:porin family protein [Dyadobacter sp. 3J3]|uniref:porin family protein n=1 Tax=Dyadobacter sp. 3J3 TaxID=2606600 RepID=UPI0013582746|nr:porin family protein [Dyadobacter sp. 3J3]
MKKSSHVSLLFLFCLFLLSFVTKAQMSVGLRAGANFANLAVQDDTGQEYPFKAKTGLNFAVLFNVPIGRTTSIQFEPGFSQRGTRISETVSQVINNQDAKVELRAKLLINYIEMPVLFQFKPKLGKIEGIFSIGPEFRLLTNNLKQKSSVKSYLDGKLISEENDESSYSFGEGSRKFDYGILGGVGVAYPLGILKIFAEGRYHFGLRNLATPIDGDDNSKVHNRGASVHLGILVPVGK